MIAGLNASSGAWGHELKSGNFPAAGQASTSELAHTPSALVQTLKLRSLGSACRGQPIELLPRDPSVLELQMQLLVGYRLPFEVVGAPGNQRLRVLPPGYGRAAEGGQARAAAAQ